MTISQPISFWRSVASTLLGLLLGLFVLVLARAAYYDVMDYRPNMGPLIALFFLPIMVLLLAPIAALGEFLFNRFKAGPITSLQAISAGACYASALSWWGFPDHWQVVFAFNPVVLRLLVWRMTA